MSCKNGPKIWNDGRKYINQTVHKFASVEIPWRLLLFFPPKKISFGDAHQTITLRRSVLRRFFQSRVQPEGRQVARLLCHGLGSWKWSARLQTSGF